MKNFIKGLVAIIIINNLSFSVLRGNEIPIIVISASKTPQSLSVVGSSVDVITEKDIDESAQTFLGNILSSNTGATNFFQSGGPGSQMGLQIRGLPKAYSTVYVDGVKKSDTTTPKNDFYFDDVLSGQISRVEILKGNQSSVYGSGAMGGTINVFSKKGSGNFKKNYSYKTGSNNTHDLNFSYGGSNEFKDFYVGLERFQTDGESAMTHNDENDEYKNHTFLTNYGYKFSDSLKTRFIYKFSDAKLDYDAVNAVFDQIDNSSHEKDSSAVLNFQYNPHDQITHSLNLSSSYMSRSSDSVKSQFANTIVQQNYWSYRNTISYNGNYKINPDHNLVFGAEKEYDEMRYKPSDLRDFRKGEEIRSKYFDIQSKLMNNLYATFGARFDEHNHAGNEDSERVTLSYLSNSLGAKFKSSYGTGIKFPSLYEFDYSANPDSLVAEHGRSYDFGIEKTFIDKGLNIDLSYFNHKYEDTIEGWEDAGYTAQNMPGVVKSQGLELKSKLKTTKNLLFDLNYTYTSTYDGADWDDPTYRNVGEFLNQQLVRVPRHLMNFGTSYKLNNNLKINLKSKWSSSARDYGNANDRDSGKWRDATLKSYIVSDLGLNYKLNKYNAFLNIGNIFNEKYSTVLDYSQPERSLNLGFKRLY